MEPKRYNADLNIPCGISPTTAAEVYLCDDPAIVEWKRKAEELDKLEENARSLDLPSEELEELKEEVGEFLLFCSRDGTVVNGFRTRQIILWLRSYIGGKGV